MRVARGVLLAASCTLAEAAWLRLVSPNFELHTDAGQGRGVDVLRRLEEVRRVFSQAVGARETPLPVRVFLFASERDYRRVQPGRTSAGFFQSGADRDYIALLDAGPETLRAAGHEYVHLVLHHSTGPLPQWLEEGTAEFYSTLTANQGRIRIGTPIPNHLRLLASQPWIEPAAFEAVHRESPIYDRPDHAGIFYAQSWALVHMLNLESRYRRHLPRLAELLEQAVPAGLAFEQAFGKPLGQALSELRLYVRDGRFPLLETPLGPAIEFEATGTPLSRETAELAQIELMLRMGRAQAAEQALKRLEAAAPESAGIQLALGLYALSQKQNPAAKRAFLRAIELGGQAVAAFEYAMILRDEGTPAAEVRQYLSEAVGRNPKLAEAQFLLGLMYQREGRPHEAIGPLEEAVKVLPRQSWFWHALALAYHQVGNSPRARLAARKAAESARSRPELEMAQAALRLVSGAAAPAHEHKPGVTVPDTWKMREGDGKVDGVLEHIDCLGQSARFSVRAEGRTIAFWVAKPGEVLLRSVSGITFEFVCGPQRPRRVLIEYVSKPAPGRKTIGEVTAIEFR